MADTVAEKLKEPVCFLLLYAGTTVVTDSYCYDGSATSYVIGHEAPAEGGLSSFRFLEAYLTLLLPDYYFN